MNRLVTSPVVLAAILAVVPAADSTQRRALPDQVVIKLSAIDAASASLSFDTLGHASRIDDGQVFLDRADMVYGLLEADSLSLGFVRGQLAKVLDLGDLKVEGYIRPEDLAPHPAVSIFHTLTVQGTKVVYHGPLSKTYRLRKAEEILQSFGPEGVFHIRPEVGHTYLVRHAPRDAQSSKDRFVKFRVLDIEPGRYITLRVAKITP